MLKITKNDNGDILITGDTADLRDLIYQLEETLDHNFMVKSYQDFKYNAWEKSEPSVQVITKLQG